MYYNCSKYLEACFIPTEKFLVVCSELQNNANAKILVSDVIYKH